MPFLRGRDDSYGAAGFRGCSRQRSQWMVVYLEASAQTKRTLPHSDCASVFQHPQRGSATTPKKGLQQGYPRPFPLPERFKALGWDYNNCVLSCRLSIKVPQCSHNISCLSQLLEGLKRLMYDSVCLMVTFLDQKSD